MGERNFNAYTNGTSALKIRRWVESPEDAKIIAFPGARPAAAKAPELAPIQQSHRRSESAGFLRSILDSSEMYCSLRYESMKGCPYNLFSEKSIAALSIGGAIIGIVSLILGS